MPTATCLTPLTAIIITESFLVSLGVGLCFIDLLPLLAVDIYSTVNKFVRLDVKLEFPCLYFLLTLTLDRVQKIKLIVIVNYIKRMKRYLPRPMSAWVVGTL